MTVICRCPPDLHEPATGETLCSNDAELDVFTDPVLCTACLYTCFP